MAVVPTTTTRRTRRDLAAVAVVLAATALGAWIIGPGSTAPAARQPNPVFSVTPGHVPVIAPIWFDRTAQRGVALPSQAVASFPKGSQLPAGVRGRYLVQVLRYSPSATRQFAQRHSSGSFVPVLRYAIVLRSVRVRELVAGQLSVAGLAPGELVVARYLYSLGTGDIVSGEPPATRSLNYHVAPPQLPIAVEPAGSGQGLTVRALAPGSGWSGEVYPLDGSEPIPLRPGEDDALQALLPRSSLPRSSAAVIGQEYRPMLNVGWVIVRDATSTTRADVALRY